MPRSITQQRKDAARDPRQGHLEAHALQAHLEQLLTEYPAALTHARHNMTSILAGTYQGPLQVLLNEIKSTLAAARDISPRHLPHSLLQTARTLAANPLAFKPVCAEEHKLLPSTQLEMF